MASISAIRSIGQRDATRLRKGRVRTTDALISEASSRTGRSAISKRTGILTADLLTWAQQADLMRVAGIGSEYADLLSAAGVETIKTLRRRNATNLMTALDQANTKKGIVQRLPTHEMVQRWIDGALALDPIVTS